VWLLGVLGVLAFLAGSMQERRLTFSLVAETLILPAAVIALAVFLAPRKPGIAIEALLTLLIVTPMAPYLYRLAFQPLAQASVLVLLIAAVGVHLALLGLGLVFFGAEGFQAPPFAGGSFTLGPLTIQGQGICIVVVTIALMALLYLFFGYTLYGKALRATAVNRLGARLVGIGTALSGRAAFALAGFIGTLSGMLIASLTTVYYDSGFIIGLKGFVAAIIGGLVSYPAAALAAIAVGIIESFSSFWASAFKEAIVFTVIIPVLLWRSLRTAPAEEEE
jgi:branched-chain amino acid transport system permease protein